MRAHIVLAGGGVKGAVLAGCVNAAIQRGVVPAGFGGTSAGAIVAFLASIGYRGEDLKTLLVGTPLADLLDDGGVATDGIARDLGWLGDRFSVVPRRGGAGVLGLLLAIAGAECATLAGDVADAISRGLHTGLAMIPGLGRYRPTPRGELPNRWTPLRLANLLLRRRGLHDGRELRRWLAARLVDRGIADEAAAATLTFAELRQHPACVPLRVVATDARSRRPVVFGTADHDTTPVVDAVVASARFPLLFSPDETAGMCLTDGGLSSNLPTFLFEDAHLASGTKTMAFDLVEEPVRDADHAADAGSIGYLRALASCAVEASDVLLRRSTAGVEYYPIPVPPGIGVFSFRIDEQARHACYDRGFSKTSQLIDQAEWSVRMQLVGEGLQSRLIAEHGSPDLFEPVLRALMDQVSSQSDVGLEHPRASISLVTSRGTATRRIVTYSLGMDGDADGDLELDAAAGCSGEAWGRGAVAVADVSEGRKRPSDWRMTAGEYAKVPETVRSVICVPIVDEPSTSRPGRHPVGVISVDCRTPLADTGWVDTEAGEGHEVVDQQIEEILWAWSRVVHALLSRAA